MIVILWKVNKNTLPHKFAKHSFKEKGKTISSSKNKKQFDHLV